MWSPLRVRLSVRDISSVAKLRATRARRVIRGVVVNIIYVIFGPPAVSHARFVILRSDENGKCEGPGCLSAIERPNLKEP